MLGALHEDSNANEMRLSGKTSSELATLLHLNSPHELVLIFPNVEPRTILNIDKLSCGLRILEETQAYHSKISLDDSLIHFFKRLDIESAHFGPGTPFLLNDLQIEDDVGNKNHFSEMKNVTDVHRSVTILLNLGLPFLARCWPSSAVQIAAEYNEFFQTQQHILSLNLEFQYHFGIFYRDIYHTLCDRDQRGVDLLQLQSLSQILSLKTCLIKGPVPAALTPEYISLLSAHQAFLAKSGDRPSFTLDYGVVPGLWVVASQCPDCSIRLQAIHTLECWPHCEGLVNSNVIVSMALKSLKAELQTRGQLYGSIIGVGKEEELSRFLFDELMSKQQVTSWSFIRGTELGLTHST
ncbi:uncharacterized protein N7483_003031 [Penicillium malachiteum]|uniref:uncharacterized protein n=1 Tax=Penicillium malachiteum TaxID=1324776 RepID=UPI002548CEC4|nr:uncharacterized protein N7483_003031 [Penicillium malachiteum]KAJ5737906.1 hypothetical protein N7483_003031 [Penicillium malachiteum]